MVGATGVAGRQALAALQAHPWFELCAVAASERSAGATLAELLERDRQVWADTGLAAPDPVVDTRPQSLASRLPSEWLSLRACTAEQLPLDELDLVFSMLPTEAARAVEPVLAARVPVISTAAAFRDEPDTPLLLPGVNTEHAALLASQGAARGWRGFVAPTPNCTTVGLAASLAPLHAAVGVRAVVLTSMQAVSGAGAGGPRVAAAALGNVLPFIDGEEDKVGREFAKILGRVDGARIAPADCAVSATCTRVPVADGHTLAVTVGLREALSVERAAQLLRDHDPWRGRSLPSAPQRWIVVRTEQDRPQPRLDLSEGAGFSTVVGRLRPDAVLGGLSLVVLSHNAVLGAAGGAVLLAEDLADRGLLPAPR
ncbi:MAG: aspartate-semialdehyde dehydrogenase [Planctomycetota bacterium]|nr:MAG: aspartate-semialdehyde dehydrogenase [Planctomycetota bacterium]